MSGKRDWVELQIKIFSRWCVNKLKNADVPKITNIVTDSNGYYLKSLLESLSEQECKLDIQKTNEDTIRIKQIEAAANALQFGRDLGVDMKVAPQAENIVDSDEVQIMGYVWAVMNKFLKFGDEDDGQDMQTSLLMWCQNQLKDYDNVNVKNFKKDWHNGLAFCALIHKSRPKLVDFESLAPDNPEQNLKIAFAAAEKYFGLEQYLQPSDIPKLDSKSMVVYVSEYYYGIAEERMRDLAAKRIGKVIKYTQINDQLKTEFNQKADDLRNHLDKVEKVLGDREIDNTMAGARKKLDDFYDYQKNDKSDIVATFLSIEASYNYLAMRLADNQRPPFQPSEGHSIPELREALKQLEAAESERNAALHAELNRQLTLVQLHENHTIYYNRLLGWVGEKKDYLNKKEEIDSSANAEYHLSLLTAYNHESESMKTSEIPRLEKIKAKLTEEHYENIDAVQAEEDTIATEFENLGGLAAHKKVILDDDLARERFQDKYNLKVEQHNGQFDAISAFFNIKKATFERDEVTHPIGEARLQIAILENEVADLNNQQDSMGDLTKLGKEIQEAKYETEHSNWVYPEPEAVQAKVDEIDNRFKELHELAKKKEELLQERLKHEELKEELALNYASLANSFIQFCSNSAASCEITPFGRTLAEVQANEAELKDDEAALNAEADRLQGAYKAAWDEGTNQEFVGNQFSDHTLDSLQETRGTVDAAMAGRRDRLKVELDKQTHNDGLCKEFADAADAFVGKLVALKDEITNSQESLRDQLANVQSHVDSDDGKELPDVQSKYQAVVDEGIQHNPHTLHTSTSVQIQLDDYTNFLKRKAQMLEDEIKVKEMRGLTQEQYDEIKQQFEEFDKDGSGVLSSKEFRACLFSLGYEQTKKQAAALVIKHGNGEENIPYDGFKDFMVDQLGDNESKDEILNSWKLINRGAEHSVPELTNELLTDEQIEYYKKEAPECEGGHNYNDWTETIFNR